MNRQLTRDDVDLRERFFSLRNVRDVADLLEVPLGTLNWHLYRRHVDRSYTAFRIAKKCGGHRSISTPVTPLKMLQEKLSRVLYLAYSTKPPVHGFAHHRSIVSNASRHVGKPYILNIDIADFFPSITFPRLHGMFKAKPYNLPERVAAVLAHMCCYKQKLPQGAPTSPVVSNMLCAQMDSQLRGLARSVLWEYTRYADDMSFSPATEKKYLPRKLLDVTYSDGVMHVDVGDAVRAIVEANHFHLNEEKARFLRSHRTQLVTGLVVNQRVNVRKRWMSDLRGMVWAWEKHGLKAAEARFLQDYCHKRANARDPGSYGPSFPSVVQGKLAFLSSVRGKDDSQYRFLQNRVDKLQGKPQRFSFIHCKDPKRSVWVYDDPLHSQGTAFVLEGIGLVSCHHVVSQEKPELFQPIRPTRTFEPTVLYTNKDLDLALLWANLYPTTALRLSEDREVMQGDDVSLVSYPGFAPGAETSVMTATVTARRTVSGRSYYILSAQVTPGQSGGPILDEKGCVVGVIQHRSTTNSKGELEGMDWGISLCELLRFIADAKAAGHVPSGGPLKGTPQ